MEVDEAHLLIKHESLRPCMKALSFLGSVAISIVIMTARCPRSLEKEIFEKLCRKVYQVLKKTDRPEISQVMTPIPVTETDFEEAAANRIREGRGVVALGLRGQMDVLKVLMQERIWRL
jgi:superfamily II DNA helicase RecQ